MWRFGPGPLLHPTSHRVLTLEGGVGEQAGAEA